MKLRNSELACAAICRHTVPDGFGESDALGSRELLCLLEEILAHGPSLTTLVARKRTGMALSRRQ